ncbi:MAG: T9SS type A sorting domain-containing protein [bacterium]
MRPNANTRKLIPVFFLLLGVGFPSQSYAQWINVFSFPTVARSIHFLNELGHPEIGFAGLNDGSIWRTMDQGGTWKRMFVEPGGLSITDITFKDRLTGWYCTAPYLTQNGASTVRRTTDGGLTWNNIFTEFAQGFTAIYYHRPGRILFLSEWGRGGFSSGDDGDTFTLFTTQFPLNGYAFTDASNGILSFAGGSQFNLYNTSDGGGNWNILFTGYNCWQPASKPGTPTFFMFSEYTSTLYRNEGSGLPWSTISTIGSGKSYDFTGCLRVSGCTGELYVQSAVKPDGLYSSADDGQTWQAIGGPTGEVDSRFWIDGADVIAAGLDGKIWVLHNALDTIRLSPQLTDDKFHSTLKLGCGHDTTIAFSFENDIPISAGLDSFAFDLSFNSDAVEITDAQWTSGWGMTFQKISNGLFHVVLKNSLHKEALPKQLLSQFLIKTFLNRDTDVTISLLNPMPFLNPTSNGGCSFIELPPVIQNATSSVRIQTLDSCGDKTIRDFMNNVPAKFRILGIYPNPVKDELRVDIETVSSMVGTITITDELGVRRFKSENNFQGKTSLNVPITSLPSGCYHLIIKSEGTTAESDFIKIH